MDAYSQAKPGQEVVIVVHDATSNRVDEIAKMFSRPDRRMRIRRVETGEINVVTAMQEERRLGHFVPIGIEGANGGTILGSGTCRDGLATALLAAVALKDPKIQSGKATIEDWIDTLPKRYTRLDKFEGVDPLNVPAIKLALEAEIEHRWVTDTSLHTIYSGYRLEHYQGTEVRQDLFGDGMGGMRVVFIRPDGQEDFIWLRPSRTEPILRWEVDALDTESAHVILKFTQLQQTVSRPYATLRNPAAIAMEILKFELFENEHFNPRLLEQLVHRAVQETGEELKILMEGDLIGAMRYMGSDRSRNVVIRLAMPRNSQFGLSWFMVYETFLDKLQRSISSFRGCSIEINLPDQIAHLIGSTTDGWPVKKEIMIYRVDLGLYEDVYNAVRSSLNGTLWVDDPYLEAEFYAGELSIWRRMRDRRLQIDEMPAGGARDEARRAYEYNPERQARIALLKKLLTPQMPPENLLKQMLERLRMPIEVQLCRAA